MSESFHVYPSAEQIVNGNEMAATLYDASVAKALGFTAQKNHRFQQLVDEYLEGKIDSVTAIFMAMNEGSYHPFNER